MTADQTEAAMLVEIVATYYPRHPFSIQKATVMLETSLQGIPYADVANAIRGFAGVRPDESKPPWSEIVARLRARSYGRRAEARVAKIRDEAIRHEQQLAAEVTALCGRVPADHWQTVYAEAEKVAARFGVHKQIPATWSKNSFWVHCVQKAADSVLPKAGESWA